MIKTIDKNNYRVSFPFRNAFSEFIQILVVKNGNGFILSDYGQALDSLETSGMAISESKMRSIIQSVKNKSGADIDCNEIILEVEDASMLNGSMLNFLYGIQDVTSRIYTAKTRNPYKSDFKSLVNQTLVDEWKLEVLIDQQFEGATGKIYPIDFILKEKTMYLDTLTAIGRSMGSNRLRSEILKIIDWKSKFTNGDMFYVGLDDRDENQDYWP